MFDPLLPSSSLSLLYFYLCIQVLSGTVNLSESSVHYSFIVVYSIYGPFCLFYFHYIDYLSFILLYGLWPILRGIRLSLGRRVVTEGGRYYKEGRICAGRKGKVPFLSLNFHLVLCQYLYLRNLSNYYLITP